MRGLQPGGRKRGVYMSPANLTLLTAAQVVVQERGGENRERELLLH